jgi:SAM-dependent methyltransferase
MTTRVDYDGVAAVYGNRYAQNDYAGVEKTLQEFVLGSRVDQQRVLEVGCGTGHWLKILGDTAVRLVGVDPSEGMLGVARASVHNGLLVRACAEKLPFPSRRFDRVFCVNALHHFTRPAAFLAEARRVLRPGGGLLIVGLDPHTRTDRWWIYDYFPNALVEDRRRYPPASHIRALMTTAGFGDCETREVQHLTREMTVDEAWRRGFLERTSTSQLLVISQAEYEEGLDRLRAASADARCEILYADLRLYGTAGWAA